MSVRPNRRTVLQMLAQCLLAGSAFAAPVRSLFDTGSRADRSPSSLRREYTRRYRIHAAVNFFSVPIISKDGVGAGCIMLEQLIDGPNLITAIQLVAGSSPNRLRGFNRYGMTQEIVSEENDAVRESAYFSFMTSSPEKSFGQARAAFVSSAPGTTLTVARGAAKDDGADSAVQRVVVPATTTWQDCPRLIDDLRSKATGQGVLTEGMGVLPTFLYAVRARMIGADTAARRFFLHNGKLYTLRTTLATEGSLIVLNGGILNQNGSTESEFRVWFDSRDTTGMPSRFELRPRNFLRLVFEHDANAEGPTLRSLIPREDV